MDLAGQYNVNMLEHQTQHELDMEHLEGHTMRCQCDSSACPLSTMRHPSRVLAHRIGRIELIQ